MMCFSLYDVFFSGILDMLMFVCKPVLQMHLRMSIRVGADMCSDLIKYMKC